jgi:RHS repeat-associated protein
MPLRRILIPLLALCCAAGAQAQLSCGPAPLGQPCGQGGIATLPASGLEPVVNLGAGNPVNLATGNKYQQELDLPPSRHAPRLELRRHYNAQDPRDSALGRGWAWSYDTRLYRAGGRWQIVQADGSRIAFAADAGGTGIAPALHAAHGRLERRGRLWVWIWPNRQQNHFDRRGRLARIVFADGDVLRIERHKPAAAGSRARALAGLIRRLVSGRGATRTTLAFHYRVEDGRAYIDRIESPAGIFHYVFEPLPAGAGQRLREVVRPDGMRRRYLYEPQRQAGQARLLTGIQIVAADGRGLRTASWAYDARGRAIMWAPGEPDAAGRLHIRYVEPATARQPGTTEITDSGGRLTRLRIARIGGHYRVLRVDGAPCAGCPAPGTRARYDLQGRLLHINGTDLIRRPSGALAAIHAPGSGWPGLELHYGPWGRRSSWASTLTGTENLRYDAHGRLVQRVYANGDRWAYRHDARNRPERILHINAQGSASTRLSWQGLLPTRIDHPRETEIRRYDAEGRLAGRDIERPALGGRPAFRYKETFQYDSANRLLRHHLPEGGALQYRWGHHGRLQAIDWIDAQGHGHSVIAGDPRRPGYRYGNGLELQVLVAGRRARGLALHRDGALVWSQHLQYDGAGRISGERHRVPALRYKQAWRYAYDTRSRLAGAQRARAATPTWYAWNEDGSLAARGGPGRGTNKPSIAREPSGLPLGHDGFRLTYGPQRRLAAAERNGQTHRYFHNARGQRIAVRSPAGDVDYFYLDNRLVAESRHGQAAAGGNTAATLAASTDAAPQGAPGRPRITRRYIYARHALVGFVDYGTDPATHAPTATLYAVHSDLLGAPRLVTDAGGRIRWLADYEPMGSAVRVAGDLELDLRLPGQVLDRGTGWHDNLLRTYLPGLGQYLETDPLGPLPGSQALGYAAQQPRRHADPLGLLLFAFDGTRNSPISQTNVWKMSQWYQDGPVFYQSGPGNPHFLDWDAITAQTAGLIIDTQWDFLLVELAAAAASGGRAETIPIDIIGFSRGAAMARHFGNMIAQQVSDGLFSYLDADLGLVTACVDLRFMGLFDTVAQFGLSGVANPLYDLSIASAWQWVAHAVALQEYRWMFPLTSVAAAPGGNTVEAPFIGAHSDIGGGLAIDAQERYQTRGDLADVALNWMLWQARAALVRFDTPPQADRRITDPILHDQRSSIVRTLYDGDRAVQTAAGTTQYARQDEHPELGRERRDATEQFIARQEGWHDNGSDEVGTVDMAGYALWLYQELGWLAVPA